MEPTAGFDELLELAGPLWAGELEIVDTYFRSPGRTPATDAAWLRRQCYKELWGSGVGDQRRGLFLGPVEYLREAFPRIDRGVGRHAVLAVIDDLRSEFHHYCLFADIHDSIAQAPLDPHALASWPADEALAGNGGVDDAIAAAGHRGRGHRAAAIPSGPARRLRRRPHPMPQPGPAIAVFTSQEDGHLQRLLPVMQGLAAAGCSVVALGHPRSAAAVTATGARFLDLFGRFPLEAADPQSVPNGMRHVAHAAHCAQDVLAQLRPLGPALVVHDTFSVLGRVVAAALDVPAVNVCAGHNLQPAATIRQAHRDLPVQVSPACAAAVERLRTTWGLAQAHPFSYVDGASSALNIYCEPPEFLDAAARAAFAPVAFFGSLPAGGAPACAGAPDYFAGAPPGGRIYLSFGTVIWRYFAPVAVAAMTAVAAHARTRPGLRLVASTGGASLPPDAQAALADAGVAVHARVDQHAILRQADAFITHHGLNSTHEAIFHGVPMLSYPFFWDQPALAARSQALGLALPLADALRAPIDPDALARGLERQLARGPEVRQALAAARRMELAVMERRPAVIRRIVALAGRRHAPPDHVAGQRLA